MIHRFNAVLQTSVHFLKKITRVIGILQSPQYWKREAFWNGLTSDTCLILLRHLDKGRAATIYGSPPFMSRSRHHLCLGHLTKLTAK